MTDMIERGSRLPRHRDARSLATPPDQDTVRYISLEAPAATGNGETMGSALQQLWRRRLVVGVATLTGAAVAAAVAWSLPPLYVAEARVIVGLQGPKVLNVESIVSDISPDAERVQNESLILQSRTVAKQVVDQLKLAENPGFVPSPSTRTWSHYLTEARQALPDFLLKWLQNNDAGAPAAAPTAEQRENRLVDLLISRLDVALLGRSHVLSVKAEAPDATTAAAIANTFAEKYLDHQRRDKIATMNHVDKFLLDRIEELRGEVRRSDQAVQDYRRLHGIYKSGTGSVASQQLSELNSQLMVAQAAKVEALSRLDEAKRLTKGGALNIESVPEVLHSPVIMALKQQLADAERKASEKTASYGERHEMLRNARAEVGAISSRLNAEVAKIVDGLEREARSTTARYDSVLANFEQIKGQMGQVNEKSIQLDALERDATVDRNLLEAMLQRAKQTMGSADVVQANGKIVSLAAVPEKAGFPPKPLFLLLGTVAGFLLGTCLAVLLERNDRSFRRPDQLEAMTGVPVLAMVPQARGKAVTQQVLQAPLSPYSEALRRLAVSIEFSQTTASPRTLLISSSVPAEGKSVMAASLARQLASSGRRVLLIDCDLRSPRLHEIFRCGNAKGLTTLLGDDEAVLQDCVRHDAQSGLDVVPAGPWDPQRVHLLATDKMARLIEAFSAHYDIVILDSSPVLATADSLVLSRLVDKVVFVVRWGHTRQDAVLGAMKQLIEARADVAGAVMSRVVPKEFERYSSGASSYGGSAMATFST